MRAQVNTVEEFKQAIERAGLHPPSIIYDDGKLHRFASNGDRDDDAGWYVLFDDGLPAGMFGDWRTGVKQKWCAKSEHQMTADEQVGLRRRIAELQRLRDEEERRRHAQAAGAAERIWNAAQPILADHPYLQKKQVKPHGLRLDGDGRLIVPIREAGGALTSLEFIAHDGAKRFISGGRVNGCFFLIGEPTGVLCIAEGFATAASVYEATGYPVAVAFSAGNLLPVAQALRLTYPEAKYIICGDYDQNGVGQAKAREAAEAVGGFLVTPKGNGMDWNDVHTQNGLEAVRKEITSVLETPSFLDAVEEDEEICAPVDELGSFPEDAWRGPFALYREAMRGTSEAPDTAHFSALWAVAAACLRRRVSFYYAFPHYPNVYLVNFGKTGDSKTSAGRQGLRLLPEQGVKLLRGVGSAEALGDWMQQPEEGPMVSHLLFIEELATLLTRGGWEGSTLLSFLTETFDAPERYEIPFRKNPVLVQEPTPTLVAGTTTEWLWKGLREIDVHGGFGNRIFYLTGSPKAPIPLPVKPNQDALAEIRAHLERLANQSQMELFLMPDAQALWSEFYLAWKATSWSELTTAAIKRVPTYIVKLSMVYACLEGTSLITADQLSAAIKVGHYGAKCADQLMNRHRQHSVQGKCEARVLAVLKEADLPPWQIHRRISGSYTAEELARAIRALEAAGVVFQVRKTRRNEPVYGRRDRKREV